MVSRYTSNLWRRVNQFLYILDPPLNSNPPGLQKQYSHTGVENFPAQETVKLETVFLINWSSQQISLLSELPLHLHHFLLSKQLISPSHPVLLIYRDQTMSTRAQIRQSVEQKTKKMYLVQPWKARTTKPAC